jgi:hypothetical protein
VVVAEEGRLADGELLQLNNLIIRTQRLNCTTLYHCLKRAAAKSYRKLCTSKTATAK